MPRRSLILLAVSFVLIAFSAFAQPGGNDILISDSTYRPYGTTAIGVASDGTIYAAITKDYTEMGYDWGIDVYRSQDGGESWSAWDHLRGIGARYDRPSLTVAEGTEDLVFLAYRKDLREIWVGHKAMDGTGGDFLDNAAIVFDQPDEIFNQSCITTDAVNQNFYYIFVVATSSHSTGYRVWYSRSINRGSTFPLNLVLEETSTEEYLSDPGIAYGFGGYLHVVWETAPLGTVFKLSEVRYRRGTASGSTIGSWASPMSLAVPEPPGETTYESDPDVAASSVAGDVIVMFDRAATDGTLFGAKRPGMVASSDSGASFAVSDSVACGHSLFHEEVIYAGATDEWLRFTIAYECETARTSCDAPTAWPTPEVFGKIDAPGHIGSLASAYDPFRSGWVAVWTTLIDDLHGFWFDSEAHGAPGYPNLAPGFPVILPAEPVSDPGLADFDGDGDQEIFWGDAAGNVQVYDHDGTPHPGWPQNVAAGLSDGPIAVGDLQNDGKLTVVAGSADGWCWAWNAIGKHLWRRQVDRTVNAPAYVSIGSLGAPYPRQVVMAAGDRVRFARYDGKLIGTIPSALGWSINNPPAIGDVDGDGTPEYVVAAGARIYAGHFAPTHSAIDVTLPDTVTASPVLADLDLDGDVEILIPVEGSYLHALGDDGQSFGPGWPTGSLSSHGSEISGLAVANVVGSSVPEIAVTIQDWRVHLLFDDGSSVSGYPKLVDWGTTINGAPVIGPIALSPDVIMATIFGDAYAWDNFGNLNEGWPISPVGFQERTPALGDVDGDGKTEVVVLGGDRLAIVDVQEASSDNVSWTWPMAGHDPRRSHCSDCYEDLVSTVDLVAAGGTRVFFSSPTPNPLAGPCEFFYSVPERTAVNLEIYDLRGRRVARVHRQESTPGVHVVNWNGRGDDGHLLASGVYLARFTAKGPGLDENLTRKFVVTR